MIKYLKDSKPTQDGWYLVRAFSDIPPELCIAEADVGTDGDVHWSQVGIDFDIWQNGETDYALDVLCRLDVDNIADSLAKLDEQHSKRRIVAIFDLNPGFQHVPLDFVTESIAARMKDSASMKLAEVIDSDHIKLRAKNGGV